MNRSSVDWDNPYRAPESLFEPTLEKSKTAPGFFWVKLFLCLQLLTTVVGVGLSIHEVETIVGSGPALAIIGILLAIVSGKRRFALPCGLGISAPVFCVAVFLTIYLRHWSPSDARIPVPVMGGLYLLVSGIISVWILWAIRLRVLAFRMDQQPAQHVIDSTSQIEQTPIW